MIDRNEVGIVNGLTVKQVSELSGVSIRTLQYYDNIGLLTPSERTEAGYRLYEEEQLATLQEILLFRELEFPLKEIKAILESPAHDREKALRQQVELLTLKKERLEGLIRLADDLRHERKTTMDFTAFDKTKLEEYAKRAREEYSGTDAYKEYEVKSAGRTAETEAVAELLQTLLPRPHRRWSGSCRTTSRSTSTPVLRRSWQALAKCTPRTVSSGRTSTAAAETGLRFSSRRRSITSRRGPRNRSG